MRSAAPFQALALVLALAMPVAAQDGSRLDPLLRVSPRLEAASPPTAAAPSTAGPASRLTGGADGWPLAMHLASLDSEEGSHVRALVQLGAGGEASLRAHGARIIARAGDIVTARIPQDAIASLGAEPAIRFVEAAYGLVPDRPRPHPTSHSPELRSHSPELTTHSPEPTSYSPNWSAARSLLTDQALAEIGAAGLHTRSNDTFLGLTGRGVIIGIVDSGLDLAHEDFRDADGRSRVIYAWDQSASEGPPPGAVGEHALDYGTECTRDSIDGGRCPLVDRSGHGTHVLGIAAGDGSATGNGLPAYRYVGVAPEAELIVVKAGDGAIGSDQLLEGVAYIFARAAELGRPAVVNLSVSTQSGPHDGSTLFERGLDRLAGPGRLIVAGAGNHGVNANESPAFVRAPIHAMGSLAVGEATEFSLVVPTYEPRPGAVNDGAILELWYDGRDSITVRIASPGGVAEAVVVTGDSALVETDAGAIAVLNAVDGPQQINGDHVAMITIVDLDEASPPRAGEWRIRIERERGRGGGEFHAWLVGGTFANSIAPARLSGEAVTNSHAVGAPATADRVIAVAAHATRDSWRTLGGEARGFPVAEPIGDIAFFSSPGPRRDGVLKPEISAPGKMVVSARAADGAMWEELAWLVEEDGVHGANLGTSMSAPFVAGALALLLQIEPGLTPEDGRDLLARSARRDTFTRNAYTGESSGTPNAQWGYGKLDVGAATRILRPADPSDPESRVNLSANPVRGDRLIINHAQRPRRIVVFDLVGVPVRSLGPSQIGEFLTVWDLTNNAGRAVANGAFIVAIEFEDDTVLQKVFVLRP